MSSKLQLNVTTVRGGAIWWTWTKAKGRHGVVCRLNCMIHVWAPWGRDACHQGRYINPRTLPFTFYLMLDRSAVGQLSSLSSRRKWQRLPAVNTLRIACRQSLSFCCRAMLWISAAYAVMQCLYVSVCLSRSWVVPKRIKISSKFFHLG